MALIKCPKCKEMSESTEKCSVCGFMFGSKQWIKTSTMIISSLIGLFLASCLLYSFDIFGNNIFGIGSIASAIGNMIPMFLISLFIVYIRDKINSKHLARMSIAIIITLVITLFKVNFAHIVAYKISNNNNSN